MMGASMSQYGDKPVSPWQARAAQTTSFSMSKHCKAEKKRKGFKLATLKKKLSNRVKRQGKFHDYAKVLREFLCNWSPREVHALVREYEAGIALRELTNLADMARPHASTLKEDLGNLYDKQYFADVHLIYQGKAFPAHRAILSVRCPYFRDLLHRYPEVEARIPVTIRTLGVTTGLFSTLLRYLYTGDLYVNPCDVGSGNNVNILLQLAGEFGTPNLLDHDMRTLLESGHYADALLVFSPSTLGTTGNHSEHHSTTCDSALHSTEYHHYRLSGCGTHSRLELRCHRAILAARSPFFRHILLRRSAKQSTSLRHKRTQIATEVLPWQIELDEGVFSRRYARVLLHSCYLDHVELTCIVRSSVSMCSLSEVQAMVAGRATHMTLIDEIIEIYQIGQFLEIPIVVQGCEDLLVSGLGVDNLAMVLEWSLQENGSAWVGRQALQYLREDFLAVAHSPVLLDLKSQHLLQAVKSDFLQASEVEVLAAVLKWGEHQLVKRIEEREPNLLSHTAHSVTRKGIKRKDLSDIELREVLAELLPHVRIDHIIPHNHEVLQSAIKRGLVCVPPSHMLGDDVCSQIAAWIPGKHQSLYTKPRVYTLYFEEAKSILEERLVQPQVDKTPRLLHHTGLPDLPTEWGQRHLRHHTPTCNSYSPRHIKPAFVSPPAPLPLDVIAVPSPETCAEMHKREAELRQDLQLRRFNVLPRADGAAMLHQLRLRVTREFGLPDSSVQVLIDHGEEEVLEKDDREDEQMMQDARYHMVQELASMQHHSSQGCTSASYASNRLDGCKCGSADSTLSRDIPDIAMATSTLHSLSLNQHRSRAHPSPPFRHLPPEESYHHSHRTHSASRWWPEGRTVASTGELGLDLGDGTNHHSGSRGSTFERGAQGGTLYI